MTTQTEFRAGLLNPATPAPNGLQDAAAGPSGKRYDVYRNNVTHSLIGALTTAFPLVHKLIGPQRFATLAPLFVRQHPPSSPLMMFYGVEFPAFLEGYIPLRNIGYLSDAARLDLAIRRSYHAADALPPSTEWLQSVSPENLMNAKFALAPATQIVRSAWPLHDIWRVSFEDNALKPRALAQSVLVTRPEFDPKPHLMPAGCAEWLTALAAGQTLAEAADVATAQNAAFELEASLTLALTTGALTDTTTRN